MKFSGVIDSDLEILQTLVLDLPPSMHDTARKAADVVESNFQKLMKANPKNPAVTLGASFAIFRIAQHLSQANEADGLIQVG